MRYLVIITTIEHMMKPGTTQIEGTREIEFSYWTNRDIAALYLMSNCMHYAHAQRARLYDNGKLLQEMTPGTFGFGSKEKKN